MKRKVIKQGNNTLTITLPRKWTSNLGIKSGDEIEITEYEDSLTINTQSKKQKKSITLNIDPLERLALAKLLNACFEQGYDTITLTYTKEKIKSWSHHNENISDIIKFFVGRLIGYEVISQTTKSITIANLSEKLTKFENILSRIFFLLEEYLQLVIDAMKANDYTDLKHNENRHDNITKLIALGLRMVSEDNTHTKAAALNYFTILNSLDKVTDFIRYTYRNTEKYNKKVSKDTIALAEETFRYLELYRHFFYKFDYKKVNELDMLRGSIKNKCLALPSKEQSIVSQCDAMVETLHGIVKSRIAFELNKPTLL